MSRPNITPQKFMNAVKKDNISYVRHSLQFVNSNVFDAKNETGDTALLLAVKKTNLEMVETLVEFGGVNVNITDTDGNTPLFIAIKKYITPSTNNDKTIYKQMINMLLNANPDINIKNKVGESPLYSAIISANLELVNQLIDAGADVDITANNGNPVLTVAIAYYDRNPTIYIQIINKLLENGVDVNKQDATKKLYPLAYAIITDKMNIIKMLIENKANINIQDKDGKTPLYIASFQNNISLVKLLVENGANVNNTTFTDKSAPLHIAAEGGKYEIVDYLIEKKANLDIQTNLGDTALHIAFKHRKYRVADLLIEGGTNLDLQDSNGNTVLHFLCAEISQSIETSPTKNVLDFFIQVIEKGANPNIVNKKGESPAYILARDRYKTTLLEYLCISPKFDKSVITMGKTLVQHARRGEFHPTTNSIIFEYLDQESMPPANVPTIPLTFRTTNLNSAFNVVMANDINLNTRANNYRNVLTDTDNIVFFILLPNQKYKPYILPKYRVLKDIVLLTNTFYECNEIDKGTYYITSIPGYRNNIKINQPYYNLFSGLRYVDLKLLKKLILEGQRYIGVGDQIRTLKATASDSVVIRWPQQRVNYVSADHCQAGSDKKVYTLFKVSLDTNTTSANTTSANATTNAVSANATTRGGKRRYQTTKRRRVHKYKRTTIRKRKN